MVDVARGPPPLRRQWSVAVHHRYGVEWRVSNCWKANHMTWAPSGHARAPHRLGVSGCQTHVPGHAAVMHTLRNRWSTGPVRALRRKLRDAGIARRVRHHRAPSADVLARQHRLVQAVRDTGATGHPLGRRSGSHKCGQGGGSAEISSPRSLNPGTSFADDVSRERRRRTHGQSRALRSRTPCSAAPTRPAGGRRRTPGGKSSSR